MRCASAGTASRRLAPQSRSSLELLREAIFEGQNQRETDHERADRIGHRNHPQRRLGPFPEVEDFLVGNDEGRHRTEQDEQPQALGTRASSYTIGVVQNRTARATSTRCRTSRKKTVAVARISAMPMVNATWRASTTGNRIIGSTSGILYHANII